MRKEYNGWVVIMKTIIAGVAKEIPLGNRYNNMVVYTTRRNARIAIDAMKNNTKIYDDSTKFYPKKVKYAFE